MPWIKFDVSRKYEIEQALRQWGKELPRAPNQIGSRTIPTVEAPQLGDSISLLVEDGFVEFLERNGSIPFERG